MLDKEEQCLRKAVNMQYQRNIYNEMVELLQHMPKKKAPQIASLRLPEFAALRRFKENMRDEFEWLWTPRMSYPP